MEIICLESGALYSLVEKVVERMKLNEGLSQAKWISDVEAMGILNIKSKTTLQYLRDNGSIKFSQPMKKVILYDRESINEYLEKHAKNTF